MAAVMECPKVKPKALGSESPKAYRRGKRKVHGSASWMVVSTECPRGKQKDLY
jgi:hypothetical protein